MSQTNNTFIILVILNIFLFVLAYQLKNVSILMFSTSFFFLTISFKLKNKINILLPIFVFLFTIAIIEFSAEYFYKDSNSLVKFDLDSDYASSKYTQQISGFGYIATPGVHSSKKLTNSGEGIYDVSYSIGTDGYRDDIENYRYYDAYIYGGSHTFGEGLNDNETLSYHLMNEHGLFVKNMGLHGFGLHQALYNIQNGLTCNNDKCINILLTAPWHSLRSSCKKNYSVGTPKYLFKNGKLELDGTCSSPNFIKKILEKSKLYQLFKLAVLNKENIIKDEDLNLYFEIIKEIKKISNKNNTKLLVAFIYTTEDRLDQTKWTNESIYNQIMKIADSVVNVTLAKKREELNSKYYIHDLDQHPSNIANKLRAKFISKSINNLRN